MDQYGAIDNVFYFHFAANTTAGAAGDGATPVCRVRLCGDAAAAAPIYSPAPTLLTEATYLDGSHEVAITASVANGFAAGSSYAVFASLTISSITPGGFLGRIHLKPCVANVTQLGGGAASLTDLKDFVDTGYDPTTHKVAGVVLTDGCTTNTDMRGTDGAALASVCSETRLARLDTTVGSRSSHSAADVKTAIEAGGSSIASILEDTGTTLPGTMALEATLTAIKGATFNGTTDSLEAIRDRGDAAWDTATGFSTHSAADVKTALEAAGSHLTLVLEDTGTTLPATLATIAAYIDTEVAAILADTNELQTDLVNGGRLDLLVDAIKTKTDGLNFTGTDVKATLDGEEVTPTAASKTGYALAATGANGVTLATGDFYRTYVQSGGGKLTVVDATGGWTLTAADGTTTAATGTITDNLTNTVRSVPTWA